MNSPRVRASEAGFSLLELLYSTSIIAILTTLSWGAYTVYKDNAEYSRSQFLLKDARTAFEVGEQEASVGHTMGFQFSSKDGGLLSGALAQMLPGAVTPMNVRLGAEFNSCPAGAGVDVVKKRVISQACASTRYIQWVRFCNGVEVLLEDVAQPMGCPEVS